MASARPGRLRACCGRCVLGSPPVAASWCALLDLTLLLFARGLPAAVLGAVGVLAALEALSGAARGSRGALWWYALYSAANVAASAALGIVVLAGVDVDCVGSDNPPACQLTQSVTGILLFAVTSSASFFAAVSSAVAWSTMRDPRPSPEAWKLDL